MERPQCEGITIYLRNNLELTFAGIKAAFFIYRFSKGLDYFAYIRLMLTLIGTQISG